MVSRRNILKGVLIGMGAATAASLKGSGPMILVPSKEIWKPKLIPIKTKSAFYEVFASGRLVINVNPVSQPGAWMAYRAKEWTNAAIEEARDDFAMYVYGKSYANQFERITEWDFQELASGRF